MEGRAFLNRMVIFFAAVQEASNDRFDELKKLAKQWWFENVLMKRNKQVTANNKRRKITVDEHYRVAANFPDWEELMRNMAEI